MLFLIQETGFIIQSLNFAECLDEKHALEVSLSPNLKPQGKSKSAGNVALWRQQLVQGSWRFGSS